MSGKAPADERIKGVMRAMLQEKSFDKITVADICERAGVARKTLYAHFRGKEGVLRCIIYDDIAAPIKTLMPFMPLGDAEAGGRMLTRQIYEGIYAHKDFYCRAVVQNHINILGEVIRDVMTDTTLSLFRGEEGDCSEKYLYAAQFTSGAHAAVIKQWLRDGMEVSPKELTDWIFEFSQSGNRVLLDPLQ